MASNYYLYNPADNLALAQAILLANSDSGMSYIIPYEEKSNNSPAQNGLTILETIDKALGAITPRNNADLASLASLPNSNFDFAPVKEMIKRSVQQAPPTGWQAADVDDPASQFTVLSVRGTPELKTSLFEAGAWRDADTGTFPRGNPYVAYGGTITDAVFVDFAGHFNQTPGLIGEQTVSKGGRINSGTLYENSPGDIITAEDNWNPVHGLTIDATGKDVTLVNFSVTSQGFAESRGASDDLAFRSYAEGVPLQVRNGDVTLSGDVVIDQVTQVVNGFSLRTGAIEVSGSGASVTFDKAHIYLGAVRGYESLIHADNAAKLQFTGSTVYGFASSNSTAPNLPSPGLLWADFESKDAVGIQHLISIDQGASASFNDTHLFREEPWNPQGAEYEILNAQGRVGNWDGNDYDNISEGEIYVGSRSNLNIENSTILGSIVVRPGAGNVSVKDSQIAGKPVGDLSGSLVQLDGGNITIENTLVDSLDVNGGAGGNGTLALGSDVHVLSTNTPDGVPVTTRSDYTGLSSFAAPSQSTQLSAWADKDTSAANPSGGSREPAKVNFQFFGPQSTSKTAANLTRELTSFISEPSPPVMDASGALIHTVRLSFSEPVTGLDSSDLEQALGSAARADGWQVTAAPLSRDGGKTWTTTIQAPATSGSNQPIQLLAGAASSTFSSTLPSLASNTLTLQSAQAGGAPGGGSGTAPHITSVVASFGSLLDTSEQANPQTITVFTEDVLDGSTLVLSLNGTTYTSQAVNNQASFLLPPADLALLPAGIDQLQVTGTTNGVTIPAATQSFSVDGAAPAAIPHITSIAPSFGASLDRSELAAPQTLAVTTTGIEAGQVLTLQIDGQPAPVAVSGGSVDAAGTASFNLPVSVLSSLAAGLHQFSVNGSNQSGTAAPPAALSFSAEGPQSVTPHVLSIVPSFGGSLSATEAATDQTVQISTEGLADGDPINLLLFGKTYTATITSNAASFTIPSADLQALPAGTDLLSITQPSGTGAVPLPSAQQSFTVEGPTPVPPPHILSITPSFGVLLDPSEAASDQTVEVRTDSFASSGSSLSLGLNGVTYTPTSVAGDRATFQIPSADLTGLPTGVQSLQANGSSGGVTAPELTFAFTVGAATSTPAHITGIAPAFGSLLDANEAASNQTVVVSTDGIADATTLLLLLNGNRLSAGVSANQASFTLSSGLLSTLNPGLQTIQVIESGNTAVSSQFTFSVESPAPVVSPHVVSIVPSFGGVLSASEAQVNQTILVGTEGVEDGQAITLSGAGLNLTETVNGGQASFTLTPAQLGALPQGLDTIQVKVSNAAGVAAPTGTQSFAVEGQSFIPSPHFTSIAPSFGSLLDATEVSNAQSVVVTTEGVPDSTALTLDINSTVTYTALVSGNTATFFIPAGDLSGLNAGVDLLQVSGTTTTGTTIPSMSQSFSVDGPAPSNTPHFTSIDPTFGAVLDSSEAATNQTIGVISTGLSDGQVLQLQLNGIQYTASVSSNNASFTIPAADLKALPVGTDTLLVNAPGTATPQGSQSFTVTGASTGGGGTTPGGGGTTPGGGGTTGSGASTGGGGTPQTLTFSDFTSNGTQTIIANIVATNEVTNSDDLNDLSNFGVALSDRAIDFKANIDKERTTSIGNIPLGALLGDLTLTTGDGKRDPSIAPIYYAINAQGALSPLSYEPLVNAGARFYDTDDDGIADFLSLKLIDGGFGDKDGVKNGVIDDPSAMGTVALDPVITALENGFLQLADAANAAPAALALQASLTSRADTVTEIGYVILNEGEKASTVSDITAFQERANTLFSTLENNDVTLDEAMVFNSQFLLRNGQSIRFFAVTDGTLADLASLEDSRFSFLDGSVDATTGAASFSSASGIGFDLALLNSDQNLSALIAQEQHVAPLLDFTAFTNNETITGTIVQAREADYDAVTGFYRVLDTSGSVRAADGSLLTPGEGGYAAAALLEANRISALGDLSIADGESSSTEFSLQDASYIAPFAQVNGNTFFAFADANTDGLSHFRSLGSNLFGLEDQLGGGDLDYDDHIMGFLISSLTPASATPSTPSFN